MAFFALALLGVLPSCAVLTTTPLADVLTFRLLVPGRRDGCSWGVLVEGAWNARFKP
jgi:hypothetical protein